MNKEHVKILVWEQSRRALKLVLAITIAFALVDLSYQILVDIMVKNQLAEHYSDSESIPVSEFVDLLFPTVYFGLFVNILILLGVNTNTSSMQFSMNQYYLRLPVSTWTLAGTLILMNCIILFTTTWFLLWISYHTILTPPLSFSFWHVAISGVLCYLPIQFIAWTFGTRATIVSLAVLYGWILYDLINLRFSIALHYLKTTIVGDLYSNVPLLAICALLCIGIAILMSGFSLRYQRFNERIPVYASLRTSIGRIIGFFKERNNQKLSRFTSPQEAQTWLEKRYLMNLLRNTFLLLLLLMIIYITIADEAFLRMNSSLDILEAVFYALLGCAAFCGLLHSLINFYRQTTTLNTFTYTKPVSTVTLAWTRLSTAFHSLFIPLMILQGLLIISIAFELVDGHYRGPMDEFIDDTLLFGIFVFYGLFIGVLIAAWCARWAVSTIVFSAYIGYFAATILILDERTPLSDWIINLMITLWIIPPIVLWAIAIVKHEAPARYLIASPIVFAALYCLMVFATLLSPEFKAENIIIVFTITVAAYMPFATVPVAIDLTRHR